MTRKEMSEIFAIMLLAYPNAEVFKGGIQKLGPTIELWTTALPEVDSWTGQRAVMKLVRECKYPPTIAEFREKAEAVNAEIAEKSRLAWEGLRTLMRLADLSPEEAVNHASTGTFTRQVVAHMGGPDKLIKKVEHTMGSGRKVTLDEYAADEFRAAYEAMVRGEPPLPGAPKQRGLDPGSVKQIGGRK